LEHHSRLADAYFKLMVIIPTYARCPHLMQAYQYLQ
jgi:hypothetical protein